MKRTLTLRRRTAVILAALVAGSTAAAHAQTTSGGSAGAPGEWLAQYTTARSLGLGGASVAAATDPLGIVWNPAALSMMDQNELRAETSRLFFGGSVNALSFGVAGSRLPAIGVTVVSLRSGEMDKTDELNDPLGTFRETETAYLLTLSKSLSPRAAVGGSVKLVQQSIEESSGGGVGFDLGVMAQVARTVRVGASFLNIGGPGITLRDTKETWATHMRGGVAMSLFGGRGLLSTQIDHADALGTHVTAGTEFWVQPAAALRLGYGSNGGSGGFTYRINPQAQLDYAIADHDLGVTHRIGLSYRFGGFFASSAADPGEFSPTGEHAVTRISLNSHTKSDPATWRLEVVNKAKEVVRVFGGQGQPPSHVEWDGKDDAGLPLPDGDYHYQLTVRDQKNRVVASAVHHVRISTGGPQGQVPVVPAQ